MSRSNTLGDKVQADWDQREFVEVVQLNVMKTISFLNQFDSTIREKIANLNEKLNKLERAVEYCESFQRANGGGNS